MVIKLFFSLGQILFNGDDVKSIAIYSICQAILLCINSDYCIKKKSFVTVGISEAVLIIPFFNDNHLEFNLNKDAEKTFDVSKSENIDTEENTVL